MKFSGLAEVNLQAETERMNWLKCLRAGHSKNIWFLDGHTFLEFILVIDQVNNTLVLSQQVGGVRAQLWDLDMVHLPAPLPGPARGRQGAPGLGEMKEVLGRWFIWKLTSLLPWPWRRKWHWCPGQCVLCPVMLPVNRQPVLGNSAKLGCL